MILEPPQRGLDLEAHFSKLDDIATGIEEPRLADRLFNRIRLPLFSPIRSAHAKRADSESNFHFYNHNGSNNGNAPFRLEA